MYLIQSENRKLIISDYELSYYAKKKGFKIIKELNNYPSLKKIRIDDRKDLKKFITYLESKIKDHDIKIKKYELQLNDFKKECEDLL